MLKWIVNQFLSGDYRHAQSGQDNCGLIEVVFLSHIP